MAEKSLVKICYTAVHVLFGDCVAAVLKSALHAGNFSLVFFSEMDITGTLPLVKLVM